MTPDCQRGSNFYHKTLLQETNCVHIFFLQNGEGYVMHRISFLDLILICQFSLLFLTVQNKDLYM